MHTRSIAGSQYRLLKPALQAYALGLLSTTTPQVLSLLISGLRGTLSIHDAVYRVCHISSIHQGGSLFGPDEVNMNINQAYRTIQRQLAFDQFPAACAVTLGGATLLPKLLWLILSNFYQKRKLVKTHKLDSYIKLLASFISALASFELLNRHKSKRLKSKSVSLLDELPLTDETSSINLQEARFRRRRSSVILSTTGAIEHQPPPESFALAGRTLDLTLFVFVRATDIVVTSMWDNVTRRKNTRQFAKIKAFTELMAAPTIFAFSSSLIMWSWFYSPDRLPRSYNTWIASAAQIDARLIEALRQCRYGRFVYGKDTGLASLLQSMCKDLKYPVEWGDPAKTVPIPCTLYHSGAGPSCEWHAVSRFIRGWKFAMSVYLPLNLLILLRRNPSKRSATKAFQEASQSSAFLGAFVALFYYGVCLARNRVGPNLFSTKTITPMMWDSGLCVGTGSMLCGWSIFLEKAARRQEMAFFVAPRALATIFERRYDRKHLWREQVAFAMSVAIVLTIAQTKPEKVRGVFGRLLCQLFK